MRKLELLVVHVEEAIRLAKMPGIARQRLSLMLLDSAAELMMHRQVEEALTEESLHRAYVDALEQAEQSGYQPSTQERDRLSEARARLTTSRQRELIKWKFDAKAAYLVRLGMLDVTHARVLGKLHRYRNDTYHRDQIRSATLSSSVKIYTSLICHMMASISPLMMVQLRASEVPGLQPYINAEPRVGPAFELYPRIAAELLAASGFEDEPGLGAALSEHVVDRLDNMDQHLKDCAEVFRGDWTPDLVLAGVQLPKEQSKSPTALAAEKFPVTRRTLEGWRTLAEGLAEIRETLPAFSSFADLEDSLEPVEAKIQDLAFAVDAEIQQQIDIMRGK